ncbi:MAG: sterol desaturase family protein [Sphingobacteriia bacterium]|nr:MAG: sterol desaturase family protein [Sphingobacteriia bacterium]TAG29144.1 MAG: sterol desaturase family protein [Sphingobacteriia bacterium]TAH08478.1 MAG: sterol desaturase family protein [Sphingobacteriia bacterium]
MDSLREQWLILISATTYLIIIGIEILLSHIQHRKNYSTKDTLSNIYLMVLNGSLDLLFRVISMGILQYFYRRSIIQVHQVIMYWICLLLLEDFMYYWLHRFDHHIRLFWAVHITHHSSKLMNFTVGFRSSVFQPLYRFVYFIPIAWLGFEPIDIVFIYAATQLWGIFVHTELIYKMGWMEYIFVTPSHHRVHHGSNPKYLDKNMGMFLIIWDKIFGSFQAELDKNEYEPIQYGLTTNIDTRHPLKLVLHEWESVVQDLFQPGISFKHRCKYLFGPPGWSHDGSRKTSKQLREIAETKE